MNLGWTQNVAILERCGSNEERAWYIQAVLRFGWKKAKLLEAIESQVWLHSSLDEQTVSCYTEEKGVTQESECDEEDTLCVPRHSSFMITHTFAKWGNTGQNKVESLGITTF